MVEWKLINEIGTYFGGLSGKTREDFEDGNAKYITYMNVFANPSLNPSEVGVVQINEDEKQNKVQKGDILFTGSSETPEEVGMSCVVTDELDGDFYMNSFCFGLRLYAPEQYNLHFLKYLFRSESIRKLITKTANGVTRFNISKARFSKIQLPIPSLSEQTRIVGILDMFTASIENLKEQIVQRRKQYEYYRDQLLDLEEKNGVEMKLLGEMAKRNKGIQITASQMSKLASIDGNIRVFAAGQTRADIKDHLLPDNCAHRLPSVIVKSRGFVDFEYYDKPFTHKNEMWSYSSENRYLAKYIYYFLSTKVDFFRKRAKANSVKLPQLCVADTDNYLIPVPSISNQSRIVSILDTFEESIANLEAQLMEREKQYEYYRNKLLTFE